VSSNELVLLHALSSFTFFSLLNISLKYIYYKYNVEGGVSISAAGWSTDPPYAPNTI
jgi:hypothetical protein